MSLRCHHSLCSHHLPSRCLRLQFASSPRLFFVLPLVALPPASNHLEVPLPLKLLPPPNTSPPPPPVCPLFAWAGCHIAHCLWLCCCLSTCQLVVLSHCLLSRRHCESLSQRVAISRCNTTSASYSPLICPGWLSCGLSLHCRLLTHCLLSTGASALHLPFVFSGWLLLHHLLHCRLLTGCRLSFAQAGCHVASHCITLSGLLSSQCATTYSQCNTPQDDNKRVLSLPRVLEG